MLALSQSKVKSIKVKTVKSTPVYDIEVPQYHNFVLANGAVVHNSKDLSDSLCGALFNASKFSDLFSLSVVDNFGTMMSINEERDISADYKESLTKAIMAAELNRPYLDADELADKREEKMLDPRFRQKVAQDLKSRLTPQEKSMVTDEELLSAFTYGSGGDDSILLF